MSSLSHIVEEKGFTYICGNHYTDAITSHDALMQFKQSFEHSLAPDGVRNRSYLKLQWNRCTDDITVAVNQNYFQSAKSNKDDGGKVRQFSVINQAILKNSLVKNIISKNMEIVRSFAPLAKYNQLTIGVHFIQYQADEMGASYSSPVGLHVDDEPLVFVHLVELSNNAIGGDNLIADLKDQTITNVVRLSKPMDTLVMSQDVYHAVTPLGSAKNVAQRDVILFTVEVDSAQKWSEAI
jgi:hypothetical protein